MFHQAGCVGCGCLTGGTLLDSRSPSMVSVFIFVVCFTLSALGVSIWIVVGEVAFFGGVWNFNVWSWWQALLQVCNELRRDRIGESYVELNDETPLLEWVFVLGQTFAVDALDLFVLDYFAWQAGHHQVTSVQGLDHLLETAQRLDELQFHHHGQICAVAELENGVLLYVQYDDDVAWLEVGFLISLAGENDALPIKHALLNVHFEDFTVANGLLAVARFASVLRVNDFSLALTRTANLFVFLDEAGHDLLNLNFDSLALTCSAGLDRSLLAATSLALLADDTLLQRKLTNCSVVDFLERHLHLMDQVLAFAFTLAKIQKLVDN